MKKQLNEKNEAFISIVILASELPTAKQTDFLSRLVEYLDDAFSDFEIIIVGDSRRAIPRAGLERLLQAVPSVRFLDLSYSVEQEVGLTAGLENAIGDYVILLSPLQDSIELIEKLISECSKGIDVVVGVADNSKRSHAYRLARPFVNVILRHIGYTIPRNSTSLRCMSRAAVQSTTRGRNYHHNLFVRIAQCGLNSSALTYSILEPEQAKRRLTAAFRETLQLLVFNSSAPLRWMSILGFSGSFFAMLFATYSFLAKLLKENITEGWSSIVIFMSFLFMLLFMMLSFFGEYLGRLLNEQSRHEPYWIVDEKNSAVMLETDRRNVTDSSE